MDITDKIDLFVGEGAVPSTEKTVNMTHKTSGKEVVVVSTAVKKYEKMGYVTEAGMSDYFVQNQKGWTKAEQAFEDGDMFNYMNMVLNANEKKMKIGKWKASEESMMGTWAWSMGTDDVIYITPFFESDGIGAQSIIYKEDGEDVGDQVNYKFKPTGNPDKDFKAYMSVAQKVIRGYK